MEIAVHVKGLTVHSGTMVKLDRLDLAVPKGHVTAIIGRANSGKSLLLGSLLGQASTGQGEIQIFGHLLDENREVVRRQTTWVARCGVLESHMTVIQNLSLTLHLCGCNVPGRANLEQALRESDVPDRCFDRRGRSLLPVETFGVWMAIARLRHTPLVLLDDPTSLLNPVEAARVSVLIRELSAQGPTVLLTTSDRRFAEDTAQTVYELENGSLSERRVTPRSYLRNVADFDTSSL